MDETAEQLHSTSSSTTALEFPTATTLEENLRSVDLEYTPEEWRDFNHAVSKIELQGDRYPNK